ncbi:MAG TPA: nucleoside triphosphate pyrophosphohydrolase [Vicinamibacterales bacterium]|nr:nucleoside triphosphate pyrophosphohydrolase [Vicinamibacterales bacterium]
MRLVPPRRPTTPAPRRRPRALRATAARQAARAAAALARLVRLVRTLRAPGGCPWDRRQTHASLRPFLLEETYEALEALDRGDLSALPGELGDVLFQCVFHAEIADEAGHFDLADAIDAVVAKLVRRHPHVFTPSGRPHGRRALARASQVVEQWERVKAGEQQSSGQPVRILAGIPRAMPALLRAHEIGSRVAAVGFDWPYAGQIIDKLDEEVRELRAAVAESPARTAEELGDVLFTLANLSRKLGIEPESALRAANDKFTARFAAVEDRLARAGRSVHDSDPEALEAAWAAIKTAPATRPRAPAATGGRSTSARRPGRRRSRS